MKKPIVPVLALLLCAMVTFAQETLTVTAKMPELTNGDKVFLYDFANDTADSTVVKDNSFALTVNLAKGASTLVLQAGVNPEKTGLGMFMLMQPGKMHIEGGNGTGFKGATFTGDAFVTDWVEMEKQMSVAEEKLQQIGDLKLDLREAQKLGDKDAGVAIIKEIEELNQQIAAIAREFLDQHLTSAASAYVLNAIVPESFSNVEKVAYLSKLSGNAFNGVSKTMLSKLTGTETQWVGKQVPEFSQPDQNGKMVSLKDFKGKYVLVDFWASWCAPCRKEAPELKAVYEKMTGKNISFVSISLDRDKSKWAQAMLEDKMPWQQLSDLRGEQNAFAQALKVTAIPAKFLIDPNGKIIAAGLRDGAKSSMALEKALNELIK